MGYLSRVAVACLIIGVCGPIYELVSERSDRRHLLQVGQSTHACWYDRAGYGWSDPARAPHTSADAAGDLHAVLNAAHVPAPYVLVGHSLGGLHVRVYTGMIRQEVAGIVLVDASHEDVDKRIRGRPRVPLPSSFRPAFETWMAF